jgi:hypothetical protein
MTLRLLLSDVLYTGSISHKGTVYAGEHDRIVAQQLWEQVNQQLQVLQCCTARQVAQSANGAPRRLDVLH